MAIGLTIENSGWHLIINTMVDLSNLDWLTHEGPPEGWVTLFGKVFDNSIVPRIDLEFDSIPGSVAVKEWIIENGFADRMKYHLHRTVCIDIDLDAYLVEWHLSFPSDRERVAWVLSMDWERNLNGWI